MSKVKKLLPIIKVLVVLVILLTAGYYASNIPFTSSVDFSTMRKNISSLGIKSDAVPELTASLTPEIDEPEANEIRNREVNESRARIYVETATNDYYKGSYEEALRRLDRARIYDPSNFSIFKLSGQIFFEKNKIRKAFNSLERANQLPNDDNTIPRNLDVLKRLIRYSRTEIDRLQRSLNKEPDDRVARARLKELEEQMNE